MIYLLINIKNNLKIKILCFYKKEKNSSIRKVKNKKNFIN